MKILPKERQHTSLNFFHLSINFFPSLLLDMRTKKSSTSSVCIPSNNYMYSIAIIGLIILSFITLTLYGIDKKINCDCVNNQNKTYLKEWYTFLLILNLIIYTSFFITSYNCASDYINMLMSYFLPLYMIIGIINLIMVIRLFLYILYLRKNCKCAYQINEKIIFWYFVIIISYIAISIAILLSLFIISYLFISSKS